MARWSFLPAVLLTLGVAGCNLLVIPAYFFGPDPNIKKVDAEFKDLSGRTLAIVLYVDRSTEYEHPKIRTQLPDQIAEEIKANIKDVRVIDAQKVADCQNSDPEWENKDRTHIGLELKADYVLYLAISEFSTREEGGLYTYRGSIVADASLYDVRKSRTEARVWHAESLGVVFPKDVGVRFGEEKVRTETQKQFAALLVKKFYKHEEKINEVSPA